MANVRATSAAGSTATSPGWRAVTVQEPAASMVTLASATAQSPVAVNDTGNPDEAVAATVKGRSPNLRLASSGKSIVWAARSLTTMKKELDPVKVGSATSTITG